MADKDRYKLLTEHYINGISPNAKTEVNANLEGGEHVKFPNGNLAEVLGESHKNGGVDLTLPQYTKILSNTEDLRINKKEKKLIKDVLDLDVTVKDTYSDVIKKYSRQIGYDKILKEQESLFKAAEKEVWAVKDESTKKVNREFFSKKLYELEQQRQELIPQLSTVFDILFKKQEEKKGNDVVEAPLPETEGEVRQDLEEDIAQEEETLMDIDNTLQSFSDVEVFEYGGQVLGKVENLAKTHGVDATVLFKKLLETGRITKKRQYDKGGSIGSEPPLRIYYGTTNISDKTQHASEIGYGDLSTKEEVEKRINAQKRDFPLVFSKYKEEISKYFDEKDGVLTLKEGVSLNKPIEEIGLLQGGIDAQYQAVLSYMEKNPDLFDKETIDKAIEDIEKERFVEEQGAIPSKDLKYGNFSSTRRGVSFSIVPPDVKEKLNELGVYTLSDLIKYEEDNGEIDFLPESSRVNINRLVDRELPEGFDVTLEEFTPVTDPVVEASPEEKLRNDAELRDVDDVIGDDYGRVRTKYPRRFFTPGFGALPPSALRAESLQTINLSRIDPVRIGIENNLQRIASGRSSAMGAMEGMSQTQRAALIGDLITSSTLAESDAVTKANMVNAQTQAQADIYNAQQADKEQDYNNRMRLDFEARTLRGIDNQEKGVRNYFAYLHNAFLNDLNRQMTLNTLDNIYPDMRIDDFGITSLYRPSQPYQLYDVQPIASAVLNTMGLTEEEYKEALKKQNAKQTGNG